MVPVSLSLSVFREMVEHLVCLLLFSLSSLRSLRARFPWRWLRDGLWIFPQVTTSPVMTCCPPSLTWCQWLSEFIWTRPQTYGENRVLRLHYSTVLVFGGSPDQVLAWSWPSPDLVLTQSWTGLGHLDPILTQSFPSVLCCNVIMTVCIWRDVMSLWLCVFDLFVHSIDK